MRNFIKILFYFLLAGTVLYLYLRWFEWKNVFYPFRKIEFVPSEAGLKYENITFHTMDDKKLNGWFIPAQQPIGTVIFCHGNAGNISHRLDTIKLFNSINLNVFIFDYRGYGKSSGFPTEKGLYLDAEAAYDYLVMRNGIDKGKITLYGESLGGAVVYDLALKRNVSAVITFGTFSSVADMTKVVFPGLPIGKFLSIKFNTILKIKQVNCPKLIIHSINDEIVPYSQGQKLFESARVPKEFYQMRGGHNDAVLLHSREFIKKIEEFLIK